MTKGAGMAFTAYSIDSATAPAKSHPPQAGIRPLAEGRGLF